MSRNLQDLLCIAWCGYIPYGERTAAHKPAYAINYRHYRATYTAFAIEYAVFVIYTPSVHL